MSDNLPVSIETSEALSADTATAQAAVVRLTTPPEEVSE